MLQRDDFLFIDGPSHGDVLSQQMCVKSDIRGAPWMELTSDNLVYITSLIASQWAAGGVAPRKRKKLDEDTQDGNAYQIDAGSDDSGTDGDGVGMVDGVGIDGVEESVGSDIVHPVVLPQQPGEDSSTIADRVQEPTKRTLHAYVRQM